LIDKTSSALEEFRAQIFCLQQVDMTVTSNRHAHAAAGGIVQMAQKLWSMLFLKVLSLAVLTSMSVRQHLRHMRTQAAAGRV
jgi:hypothetical protein